MSDEFITTEDFINANRSPPLQPTCPNYRSTETPPPLDDSDEDYDSDVTDSKGEGDHVWTSKSTKGRPQPSLCDTLLIQLLGPNYPEVASEAGRKFLPFPEVACEDHRPSTAATAGRMLNDTVRRTISGTADESLARAAFEASEKLHAAIHKNGITEHTTSIIPSGLSKHATSIQVVEITSDSMDHSDGSYRRPVDLKYIMAHNSSNDVASPKPLNVKPPPKVSLPAIRTRSPDWRSNTNGSMHTSPTLAKFTITPADGNPQQQLPKLQSPPSQQITGLPPARQQTLPSLTKALGQIPDHDPILYSGHSSATSRASPVQFAYATTSPSSALSPPRMSSNPSHWRTTSHETMTSTPSDHSGTAPSAGVLTPSSSYYGHSSPNAMSTPGTIVPDGDSLSAVSASSSQLTDGGSQYNGTYGNGSFRCIFPGCNAAPFQTQYLLNSHANVHSNTRPHFCPVQGCPRGPGGQGFKRKNEMIRHGLVHQSPGYVCPFCPDQQHKYPRPDNLQRHVRVHHIDRDRDDPLLREVLAQRLEGGNRGRRRRLGS